MKLTANDKKMILKIWHSSPYKYGLKTALAEVFGVRREYIHKFLKESCDERQFLDFLARDIANHPERLQAIDFSFVQQLQSLTGGIEVDLDGRG
jgi:hypothetical protein